MINLVNQNKHHARKCTAILQVTTTLRSYIFVTYPKVPQRHINLFRYINTYTFIICTREYSACSRSCWQKLGITFGQLASKYQNWRK